VSRPKLIGLVGRARSGKDSVARRLYQYSYHPLSLAEPLKRAACEIFGIPFYQAEGKDFDREAVDPTWGISVREMLQKLGTEGVRDVFGEDHWVRLLAKRLDFASGAGYLSVVTDIRFPNEVEMIRARGGEIWGVVREGYDHGPVEHESERLAAENLEEVSDRILTASDLETLYSTVDRYMQ